MQGLQLASAGPAALSAGSASGGAALPGNAGSSDAAEDTGGSVFGAILAFQIKDKVLAAKSGVEMALPEKADADKGALDSLALGGAEISDALRDLLALIHGGAASIQIAPTAPAPAPATAAQDAFTQRGGDQLALPAGKDASAIAGLLASLTDAAAGKIASADNIAAAPAQLAGTNDAPPQADLFAGLLAGKAMDAGRPAVEGFAAGGKMLPKVEPLGQNGVVAKAEPLANLPAGKVAEDAAKPVMENFSAGNKALPAVEPVAAKPAPEAFMPDKSTPAKPEAVVEAANDPSALLAMPQTAAMAGSQASATPAPAMEIAAPVGSPGWGSALADKVAWMSSQGNQVAELHLNPPHLGPLEVQLTVTNDQASAVFVSHHPAVREAIEAAMPRLREMLAENGIMLGNTMVGAESFQQQQQQAFAKNSGGGGSEPGGARDDGAGIGALGQTGGDMAAKAGKGMVDTFV